MLLEHPCSQAWPKEQLSVSTVQSLNNACAKLPSITGAISDVECNHVGRLGKKNMETWFVLVLWVSLILVASPQVPEEPFSSPDYGTCGRFELSQLGKFEILSQQGLVAQNLRFLAPDNASLPYVQIQRALRTCESLSLSRNQYATVTVWVRYTCIGFACGNTSYEDTYIHLFSFACDNRSTYSTLDFFAQHPFVNRSTTNSGFTRSQPGSCTLCTVDPTMQDQLNIISKYYPVTGCLGMHLLTEV